MPYSPPRYPSVPKSTPILSPKPQPATTPTPPLPNHNHQLNHKFPSSPATAAAHVVNTLRANAKDLTTVVADTFPVIIRLEALTEDANAGGGGEARSLESLDPGCELPQWVQSQTTYARLVKEDDGSWGLRVIKQKIWVKGTAYELQVGRGAGAGWSGREGWGKGGGGIAKRGWRRSGSRVRVERVCRFGRTGGGGVGTL